MFKLLLPLVLLIIVCLFTGASGLKLLGFILLCAALGVAVFFLVRLLATKFPKLFKWLSLDKSKQSQK